MIKQCGNQLERSTRSKISAAGEEPVYSLADRPQWSLRVRVQKAMSVGHLCGGGGGGAGLNMDEEQKWARCTI